MLRPLFTSSCSTFCVPSSRPLAGLAFGTSNHPVQPVTLQAEVPGNYASAEDGRRRQALSICGLLCAAVWECGLCWRGMPGSKAYAQCSSLQSPCILASECTCSFLEVPRAISETSCNKRIEYDSPCWTANTVSTRSRLGASDTRVPCCVGMRQVRAALGLWDGSGAFVFTSSTGVYAEDSGPCSEEGPLLAQGHSERTNRRGQYLGAEVHDVPVKPPPDKMRRPHDQEPQRVHRQALWPTCMRAVHHVLQSVRWPSPTSQSLSKFVARSTPNRRLA